jgi:hypothetical protein
VRQGIVMMQQPGLFLPKFGVTFSQLFMQLEQNVSVEPRIQFGLLGQIVCVCATTTAVKMAAAVRNILDTTSYIQYKARFHLHICWVWVTFSIKIYCYILYATQSVSSQQYLSQYCQAIYSM